MTENEIILVNDNSKDNTTIIIQELVEKALRIKIINNEKICICIYKCLKFYLRI